MKRPIVIQRGVAPPPPRDHNSPAAYPWEDLGPPTETVNPETGETEAVFDSFFVPYEMKNASSTIAKAKDRFPDRDFEWRRWDEEMLGVDEDDGQEKMLKVRGIRFWRTK